MVPESTVFKDCSHAIFARKRAGRRSKTVKEIQYDRWGTVGAEILSMSVTILRHSVRKNPGHLDLAKVDEAATIMRGGTRNEV